MNWRFSAALTIGILLGAAARAEDTSFTLTIKDHRFDPVELVLPADTKVAVLVKNLDSTPEEFESLELHREKVIPGGSDAKVFIGPLKPGRYEFYGEFNQDTARGAIVVK